MTHLLSRARAHLTFANVTAATALFIALGGTGYALTIPRNSVGPAQIKRSAVGSSEIRDRSVKSKDISRSARSRLAGPSGPPGPSGTALRAAITAGGARALGNATASAHTGATNVYTVDFAQDVSGCVYSAVLASVQAGPVLEQPPAGRITVASGGASRVTVRTFAADGSPAEASFHLTVSC